MLEIHDIKPIVEIPDISIYIYYGLIIFAIFFVSAVSYLLYKYFRNKKPNQQKEYFNILKNIDFQNQKKSAYLISKYGRLLVNDERQKRLLDELIFDTNDYKYKKEITKEISQEVKVKFDTFMESLDVR